MVSLPTCVYDAFPQYLQSINSRYCCFSRLGTLAWPSPQIYCIGTLMFKNYLWVEKYIKLGDGLCLALSVCNLAHNSLSECFCINEFSQWSLSPTPYPFFQGCNNHYLWHLKLSLSCVHHICKYTIEALTFSVRILAGSYNQWLYPQNDFRICDQLWS